MSHAGNSKPARIARRRIVLFSSLHLLAFSSTASAVAFSWISDSLGLGGNWTQASHWSPGGGPPANSDTALISATGSAYTVTLDSNPFVAAFTLDSADCTLAGAGRTMTAPVINLLNGTITGTPTLLLSGSATLNVGGGLSGGFNAIAGVGTTALTIAGDALTPGRTLIVQSAGGGAEAAANLPASFVNQSSITFRGAGGMPGSTASLISAGTLVNEGSIVGESTAVEVWLRLSLDNRPSGAVTFNQNASLGVFTIGAVHTNRGTINIAATKTLTVFGQSFDHQAGVIQVDGTLTNDMTVNRLTNFTQSGGTMAFGASSGGLSMFAGTINLQAGVITGNPTIAFPSGGGTLVFNTDGSHTGDFTAYFGPALGDPPVNYTLRADKLVAGRKVQVQSGTGSAVSKVNLPLGLINEGTIDLVGGSQTSLISAQVLVNKGFITANTTAGSTLELALENEPSGVITLLQNTALGAGSSGFMHVNRGTITLAAGKRFHLLGNRFEQAAGLMTVEGTLSNDREGGPAFPAAFLQSGGTIAFGATSGGFEAEYNVSGHNISLQAGVVTGNPIIALRDGTLTMSTDGSHTGDLRIIGQASVAGDNSTIRLIADRLVPGRTYRLDSIGIFGGASGRLLVPEGFINQSEMTLVGNAHGIIEAPGTFVNEGTVSLLSAQNNLTLRLALDNRPTGLVDIQRTTRLGEGSSAFGHINRGIINVAAGQTLSVAGGSFEQQDGTFTVNGILRNNGVTPSIQLFKQSGGLIQLNTASVVLTGVNLAGSATPLQSGTAAQTNFAAGSRMTCASFSMGGDGLTTVSMSASSTLDAASQMIIDKFGTLTLDATSAVDVGTGTASIAGSVRVSNNGLLIGAGTVNGSISVGTGTFRLGTPVAAFNSSGSYASIGQSLLEADIGGPAAGSGHDQLIVGGSAAVNGQLSLSILNSYNPAYLLPHALVVAGSLSGNFTQVNGSQIAPQKILAITYDADNIFVTAALPGDSNLDGITNISDFAILASNFNEGGTWADGNYNQTGLVDISDFALLAANFNVSIPLARTRETVPEPATALMLSVLACGLRRHRRPEPVGCRVARR